MMTAEQAEPKSGLPLHLRFHLAGAVVLGAGLVGALLIYSLAPAQEGAQIADEMMRRQYEFQLERIGGKALIFVAQFNQWLASLWHGERLAYTVAFLSTMVALVCFWIGNRLYVNDATGDQSEERGNGA